MTWQMVSFAIGYAWMIIIVYRYAHKNGFVAGMKLGLAVFRTKIPLETYKSICQARVEELDALRRVKP